MGGLDDVATNETAYTSCCWRLSWFTGVRPYNIRVGRNIAYRRKHNGENIELARHYKIHIILMLIFFISPRSHIGHAPTSLSIIFISRQFLTASVGMMLIAAIKAALSAIPALKLRHDNAMRHGRIARCGRRLREIVKHRHLGCRH